jgi:uncharacterized protein (DUF1684 family)
MIKRKYLQYIAIAITWIIFVIILSHCDSSQTLSKEEAAYTAEIEEWHARRLERLRSKTGWLSLAGLYWLKEGENTFGSDPANDLKFPEGKSPGFIGSIFLEKGRVRTEIREDIDVFLDTIIVKEIQMEPDITGKPTILKLDSLSWFIIKREDRFGVRLRDSESEYIKEFTGIEMYPADTTWRLPAKLESYYPPIIIEVPNIFGKVTEKKSPGALVFAINGINHRLDAIGESSDKKLFIIFADQTNGHETYGAGRFVYVDNPGENGLTVIDFNKAYNPPCAFTPFATCPLPPQQNVLPIRITAGEKKYGEH